MAKARIQKLVTFSPRLYRLARSQANKVGLGFPQYIRHLVVSDVRGSNFGVPLVDPETERSIGEGLRDIQRGDYYTLSPKGSGALFLRDKAAEGKSPRKKANKDRKKT